MRRISFTLAFLTAATILGSGLADATVACVKTQCEGKGKSCVETLYVTYDACVKTARAKCDSVPASEKFNCLTNGLRPCAVARNGEQDACLSDLTSCYRSCGPFQGKRNDYWCVASFGNRTAAVFCAADPANASPLDQCTKAFNDPQALQAGMTCEPLR